MTMSNTAIPSKRYEYYRTRRRLEFAFENIYETFREKWEKIKMARVIFSERRSIYIRIYIERFYNLGENIGQKEGVGEGGRGTWHGETLDYRTHMWRNRGWYAYERVSVYVRGYYDYYENRARTLTGQLVQRNTIIIVHLATRLCVHAGTHRCTATMLALFSVRNPLRNFGNRRDWRDALALKHEKSSLLLQPQGNILFQMITLLFSHYYLITFLNELI